MGKQRIVVQSDGSISSYSVSSLLPTCGVIYLAWKLGGVDSSYQYLAESRVWTMWGGCVLITAILVWILYRTIYRGKLVGFSLSIDASGVYLEDILEPMFQAEANYQPHLFVPRQEIVDCVVTEIILVHKVENAIVLRRHQKKSPVDMFPMVNLTYNECLCIRQKINAALERYN